MKISRKTLCCRTIILCAALVICANSAAPQGVAGLKASSAHTDPVTETTLREYFEKTHYIDDKKKQWSLKDTPEEQKLPPWYPLPVWKEFEAARQQIDIVAIALPIYQKYVSENVVRTMTRLSDTPQGQVMARQMSEDQFAAQANGQSSADAYRFSVAAQRTRPDAAAPHLLDSFAPTERHNLSVFLTSGEWKQFEIDRPAIATEVTAALSAKQKELVHETTVRHKQQLVAAQRAYEAAHASPPNQ